MAQFIINALVVGLGAVVGTLIYKFVTDHLERNRYKWQCPEEDCEFKLTCSDLYLKESVAASHLSSFHPESNLPE